jgi:Na+-transporting methylmalonyl-CoA/oxaloacetate decarboxylase gamma subunit
MSSLLIADIQPVADSASIGPIDLKTALLITLVVVTIVLVAVTRKLSRLHRRIEVLETTAPFPKQTAEPAAKNGTIPPETVAAISAAIHTTLRGRHRILSVGEINVQRQAWSLEGRRQVFSSHKVR